MSNNEILRKGDFAHKVILVSIDGMRPDAVQRCDVAASLEKLCAYTYTAQSVNPTITLPCHYSMMHSVPPARHGITTNIFVPQVRPVDGIFERVAAAGGCSALFYGWEPMRDIYTSGCVTFSSYINAYTYENSDAVLTEQAEEVIQKHAPDFVYLYMVETDEKGGHDNGWMTDAYIRRVQLALKNAKRMIDGYGDRYSVIITADHGGHDRCHGTDSAEDMTIPMFFYGKPFTPGALPDGITLLDIAPTIAKLMHITPAPEWEGRPVF